MIPVETVHFPNGRTARLVRAAPQTPPDALLAALDLGAPRALVVLCGGAGGMSRQEIEAVRPLIVDGLVFLNLSSLQKLTAENAESAEFFPQKSSAYSAASAVNDLFAMESIRLLRRPCRSPQKSTHIPNRRKEER